MKNNKFKFFIPEVDIIKSKNEKGEEKLFLKGVASTTEKDTDGQILDPSGFDLSFFKNAGFINWNHLSKTDPSMIIGEPYVAKITPNNEFYIEAELYSTDLAKKTYDLAETLKKDSNKRKLGWSIEGKVIEKDLINPNKIKRALVTGVAVTPSPKNGGTWVDILKGNNFDDEYVYDDLIKAEEGEIIDENQNKANGGHFYIIDILKPNGDRIIVDTDFNLKVITKALAATEGSGQVLKKEDLEPELKYQKEILKGILILTNAYKEGMISEQLFIDEIKPSILNKLNLIKGKKDNIKKIEIEYRDGGGRLEELIYYIKKIGNIGHSFDIIVDPDNSDYKMTYEWDGDGSDRINSIKIDGKEFEGKRKSDKERENNDLEKSES